MGRPKGRSGDDTRNSIVDSARGLFAQLGFAGATNAEIARAAGVTAAAMYRHFDSKPHLYAAVVHDCLSKLTPALQQAVSGQATAQARVRALIKVHGSFDDAQLAAAHFLSSLPDEMQRHPEVAKCILSDPGEVFTLVTDIVAHGVHAGEIASALEGPAVSVIIAGLMGLSAYRQALGADLGAQALTGFLALLDGELFRRAR